jgi:hypothetical protein
MPPRWNQNRLTEKLGIDYPVIQGPLGGLSSQKLTAAGRSELLPLWRGKSANLPTCTNVSAFLTSLVEEVSEIAGPVIQWSADRREKRILK